MVYQPRFYTNKISIHAPHAGSDCTQEHQPHLCQHFNPRSPCGERLPPDDTHKFLQNFNPRSPCGERRDLSTVLARYGWISIHAPHAGSDSVLGVPPGFVQISIHAPHAGSDGVDPSAAQGKDDFNPRSPCGERRGPFIVYDNELYFNPRSPCGERQYTYKNL